MKKNLLGLLIPVSALVISCKKDDSGTTPTPPAAVSYMNAGTGNTWNYENTRNPSSGTPDVTTYSITSSNRDTTINAKSYHVFTRTDAFTAEYYYTSGNDYYEYLNLPVLDTIRSENLYLKSNLPVGSSWTQSMAPVTYVAITANLSKSDTIIETGLTKVVKGVTYDSVIHVRGAFKVLSITPVLITPTLVSVVDNYYAPRVGKISSYINIHLTAPAPFAIDESFENKTELISTNF